jgi:clan AA aspartic protease
MNKKTTSSRGELHSNDTLRTIRITETEPFPAAESPNDFKERNALMGEVRVKVRLTNAVDEALVRRGLLAADKVRFYEADALVDTGAVRSVLPPHVVQKLGLPIVRKTRATYANDATEEIGVTEVVGIELLTRRTTEETLVLGSEVIIGQTVLESLDLHVDCLSRRVIGNPAHPDQPIIKIKRTDIGTVEPKRVFLSA